MGPIWSVRHPTWIFFGQFMAARFSDMLDVHERRHVAFTASDAAAWKDPELSGEQAAETVRSVALGRDKLA